MAERDFLERTQTRMITHMRTTICLIAIFTQFLIVSSCSEKNNESTQTSITTPQIEMHKSVSDFLVDIERHFDEIDSTRKSELEKISSFIREQEQKGEKAQLTFICTHNSRRSHLSQIWASVGAAYYNLESLVENYSGGTEITAFNPRAVAAIKRAGLKVENPGGENPHYLIRFSDEASPILCFSKKYDHQDNPSSNFVAVMTCSHADENCPFIPGANFRVAIPYIDPKESDGSDQETQTYDERNRQIATEMLYMMSKVRG